MQINIPVATKAVVVLCLSQLMLACDTGSHTDHQIVVKKAVVVKPWTMTQQTDKKYFSVKFTCQQQPAAGDFQVCHIMLKRGVDVVIDAKIAVDGGMTAHGHGLPTAPKLSATDIPGHYKIDGLKFSMPGEWVIGFKVLSGQLSDQVVFTVLI